MSLVKTDQLTNLSNNGPVEVLEGLSIPVGKSLSLKGPLLDKDGESGDNSKVLTSTADGVIWSDPQDLNTTYSISSAESTTTNSRAIRLTSGGSGGGISDDVLFKGDGNINFSGNENQISLTLVQNISSTSDVSFKSLSLSENISVSGQITPAAGKLGVISYNGDSEKWEFSNDGTNFFNFLLPTETVYDVAKQFGASADGNGYIIDRVQTQADGSKVFFQNPSDINNFDPNQRIKIFNLSATDTALLPGPVGTPITVVATLTQQSSNSIANSTITPSYYAYCFARYNIETGEIGSAAPSGNVVENVPINLMNIENYNKFSLTRTNANQGFLVYRGIFNSSGAADTAIQNFPITNSNFKLIAVLSSKEFEGSLTREYIDYGEFDLTNWTRKNTDGTYKEGTVHFPLNPQTSPKRGWTTASIGNFNRSEGSFVIDALGLQTNDDFDCEIYHDDTQALQNAIDSLSASAVNFLFLPGGVYLIDQLKIPDGFSLSGLDDATILKKQYWSTENFNSETLSGLKNALLIGKNFDASSDVDSSTWRISDFTLKDLVIDGNSGNQVLYSFSDIGVETNNTLIGFPNSNFVSIKNVKIRNSPGPALFAEGSINLTISTSTFFDGCDTERYETDCLLLSDCENLTITGCVFRNYPGALDLTTGKVIVINGSTIRNCGSGIKIFGSVNTDVLNNVILGPSDEFIPVADLYDSDYDGVNISAIQNTSVQTPVYSYQEFGSPKDLSDAIIKFDVYNASVNADGLETVDFDNPVTNLGSPIFQEIFPLSNGQDGTDVPAGQPLTDRSIGEIQFAATADATSSLPSRKINSFVVYQISGIEYDNVGSDIQVPIGGGTVISNAALPDNSTLTRAYSVDIVLSQYFNALIIGDYVKLIGHLYPTEFSGNFSTDTVVWKIVNKVSTSLSKSFVLQPYNQQSDGTLTVAVLPQSVDSASGTGGGFFRRRDLFIIARGVLSVQPNTLGQ